MTYVFNFITHYPQQMKYITIILSLAVSLNIFAQSETPDLITDRPDQTESSSVVPLKSLQIETGFIMESNETSELIQKSFNYNTTLLRYGLLENFELRLGLAYLNDREQNKVTDIQTTMSGLSPLSAGFKLMISNEDGFIPEVALLGGLVLPFTAQSTYKPSYVAANMRFSISHTLSERLSIGYNLGAEWDGETAIPAYFYSVALGVSLSKKIGMFVESYGLLTNNSEHLADAGFTYAILPNLQLDISGGIGLNDTALDNFISCGLSLRLPE